MRFLITESVFDLISKEDQDKLVAIRSTQPMLALRDQHRAKRREAIEQEKKEEEEKQRKEEKMPEKAKTLSGFNRIMTSLSEAKKPAPEAKVPETDSTLYKVGTSFKPFASNPEKQQRYEAYLEAKKTGATCKYRGVIRVL